MSLKKRDRIIAKIAEKYEKELIAAGYTKKDATAIIRSQIDHLRDLMKEGKYESMLFHNFGKFYVKPGRIPLYTVQIEKTREKYRILNERAKQQSRSNPELLENQPSNDNSGTIQDPIQEGGSEG